MKKGLSYILCFLFYPLISLGLNAPAEIIQTNCPHATPTTDPNFCQSFMEGASCRCEEKLPAGMCTNFDTIYRRMIALYGSQERACQWQEQYTHDTPYQECMDDINCYRNGGLNSQGGLCSGTGKSCTNILKADGF